MRIKTACLVVLMLVTVLFVACNGGSQEQIVNNPSESKDASTDSIISPSTPALLEIWDAHTEAEQQQACSTNIVTPDVSLATCKEIFLLDLFSFPVDH